jgi:hypothetical protein
MMHVLLVMSNLLFVLWIIGVEARHVDDAWRWAHGPAICQIAGRSTASATAATTNGSARRGR